MKSSLKRIAVLMGGDSSEREISLRSGKAVSYALQAAGYKVVPLDTKENWRHKLIEEDIQAAFIALHGRNGEDGSVQAVLDKMKIPYPGSGPLASRISLDKTLSKAVFEKLEIPSPEYAIISKTRYEHIPKRLGFPLVVKPPLEGSSIGLSICENQKELEEAVRRASYYGQSIIAEKYIPGREITVGIFENKALPVLEVVPKERFYNFKAKYTKGATGYLVPAPLPRKAAKEAQHYALLAHRGLGCRLFSRVDMIYGADGSVKVLEVNSIPGFTSSSLLPKAAKAAGIDFETLCSRLIEKAYNYRKKKR